MDEALRQLSDIKRLDDPVLIGSLSGFTDGSGAAQVAIDHLIDVWGAEPLAEIDPEPFFDFTVQRPRVALVDGEREIQWPENRFYVARPPGATRDFVLLSGIEPHLRWRRFTAVIAELAEAVGSTMSITLGAQPSGVPHTRPVPVSLSASDSSFEELFGLRAPASRYQGQTGIVGVLNLGLRARGWRNASLWAMVPHYISVGPNPNVAISLIELLDRGFGTTTDLTSLREEAEQFEDQVQSVLADSDEATAYVRQLEEQFDTNQPPLPAPREARAQELPSAEDLLTDLERFLKDQRQDT
ncbi:MAG: PAC2 family protein [Chloroflexi bacterium]|nr:PAC2 family protein [Chloroflexota bacterium]MDA1147982.1 PAC2 family protein [Chloroflexota bacterium]MQC82559.1 PAC2 family protein [Chloroflexota bacterium]